MGLFNRFIGGLRGAGGVKAFLQSLLNGFPLNSITGGGQIVPDYLGTLRKVNAGVPAIEGGRWATTIAEGATLGPELVVNGDFSAGTTGWETVAASIAVDNGALRVIGDATIANHVAGQPITLALGRTYRLKADILAVSGISNTGFILNTAAGLFTINGLGYYYPHTVGSYDLSFVATKTACDVRMHSGTSANASALFDNISVREVIPQWLDVTPTGLPLQPFRMTRTKNGTIKEYLDIPDRVNSTVYALGAQVSGVANVSALSPELVPVLNLQTGTWLTSNATVTGATSFTSTGASGRVYRGVQSVMVVGKRYNLSMSATLSAGTYRLWLADGSTVRIGNGSAEFVCTSTNEPYIVIDTPGATLSNLTISIKEVIPTRCYYTCTTPGTSHSAPPVWPTSGTVADNNVVWTYSGYATMNFKRYLGEPARVNKVTCRKTNPVDTTNITKSGDAAAVLSVVDDTAALTAAGLLGLCTSGKVYKLDNSAGATTADATAGGLTGNTNSHSSSVYARVVGGGTGVLLNTGAGGSQNFTGEIYQRVTVAPWTPVDVSRAFRVRAPIGGVVYFILPELIEAAFLGSPCVPGALETDALATYTRAATILSCSTTNVLREQNCAVWGKLQAQAVQADRPLFSSYIDVTHGVQVRTAGDGAPYFEIHNGTGVGKYLAGVIAANTPFQYRAAWTDQGMIIQTRSLTAGVWSAWSAWATHANTAAAPIAATYEIGSRAGANQFSGYYPEFRTLFLPTKATLAEYQAYCADEANWGA